MLTGATPLSLGRPAFSADGLGGENNGGFLDQEEVTFILSIMSFLRDGILQCELILFYDMTRQLQVYEPRRCTKLGSRND